jgi:GAF domain-containing protein
VEGNSVAGLLRDAARRLVEELGASGCVISRLIGELLVELAEHATTERTLSLGHGYLLSDYPLTRAVFETRSARIASLAEEDPEPSEAKVLEELGLETVLMLPLEVDGRPWALVEVYHSSGGSFSADDVRRAQVLVADAARRLAALEPA